MGLDFSHSEAHWTYMGFNRFRTRLASAIGINLDSMEGFTDHSIFTDHGISWDTVTDPIKPLLNHSDCDGHLVPSQCARIAPRLREILKSWPDDYDKQNGLLLAEGMEKAAEKKQHLKFM